jgi:chromosome segregation ATPase
MENVLLDRRIETCEKDIKGLSLAVVETKTNMVNVQKVVDDFSEYIKKSIETLVQINFRLENLDDNQKRLEKQLSEIKCKVDNNEELSKIDLRKIQRDNFEKTITKVLLILTPLGLIGLGLILLLR